MSIEQSSFDLHPLATVFELSLRSLILFDDFCFDDLRIAYLRKRISRDEVAFMIGRRKSITSLREGVQRLNGIEDHESDDELATVVVDEALAGTLGLGYEQYDEMVDDILDRVYGC